MMNKKKDLKFEIIELFMARANKNRCFYGTIKRETDADGNPVVRGKIKINDGYIYAIASDQSDLGERLDNLVLMILDKGLHQDAGVFTEICDTEYFLN